jgi:hypothetical protein
MRRLLTLLCMVLLCAACSEPPQKEIDRAQGAIEAARAAGAEQYAPSELAAATTALQQSHDAVRQGEFRIALSRALDAGERAKDAAKQAADGKARARSDVESTITATSAALQQLRTAIKSAEAARVGATRIATARQTAAGADATLQKARALLKSEQYLDARDALKGTSGRITQQIDALSEASRARAGKKRQVTQS